MGRSSETGEVEADCLERLKTSEGLAAVPLNSEGSVQSHL